jgi:hypothetical protein
MRCSLSAVLAAGLALGASGSEAAERADIHETPIKIGAHFTSPNGHFAAELTDENEHGQNLHITDTRTGAVYKSALSLPLFFVTWTHDCRTIVAVEHLAGGSQMSLIHFSGRSWKRFEVEPPGGDSGHYDVIGQEIRQNSIRVTYKMTKEKADGDIIAFYTCAFDIDPSTHAMRDIDKQRISRDTFVALRR